MSNRGPLGVQFGKPVKSVLESPRLKPRLTRNQVRGFWAAWTLLSIRSFSSRLCGKCCLGPEFLPLPPTLATTAGSSSLFS